MGRVRLEEATSEYVLPQSPVISRRWISFGPVRRWVVSCGVGWTPPNISLKMLSVCRGDVREGRGSPEKSTVVEAKLFRFRDVEFADFVHDELI